MKKLIISFFILFPSLIFAQTTEYQLLEPLPCIQGTGQTCDTETGLVKKINPETFIAYVYKFSFAFASVAAVIVIMYAGFEYATTDIIGNKSDAKKRIWNAIYGLIILFASYLILNTIDPRLTDINTKLPPLDIKGKGFDFDDLVNTANDYQIKRDLSQANAESKRLRTDAQKLRDEAASLRDQAVETPDSEKSQKLREDADAAEQKAVALEKEAVFVGSQAALKATADLGKDLVDSLTGWNDSFLTKEQKASIADRKYQINAQADKDIKKMTASGDVEGAKTIDEERNYYLAKLDFDIFTKQDENLIEYNLKNASNKEEMLNKNKAYITEDINKYKLPDNLSPENKAKLEKEKQDFIEKIKAITPPKP